MRVVIGTAHDEKYDELAAITFPTVQRYADKHGYTLSYNPRIDPVDADACKAKMFLSLYATGQYAADDVFMWIDTDALIMNSEIPIEDRTIALGLHSGTHFLWGYDYNGPNSGVWFARFTSQAAHYVQVYNATAQAMGWGDQEAMVQKMLVLPFSQWVKVVPGFAFNSYPYDLHGRQNWAHKHEINAYRPGAFVLHAAGLESEMRLRVLREYAALAT
jgi:hypothetical protein